MGAALVTAALMLGVYSIVESADFGWTSWRTLGLGALAIVLFAAFIRRQMTAKYPLMPLGIFRSRSLSSANAIQGLLVAGMLGMFFLSSLYMERVLGFGPLELGLAFMPVALIISALSLSFAPWLTTKFGPRPVLLAGLALTAAGLALLSRAPVSGRYVADVLPVMILVGVGIGISFPAILTLAMDGVTEDQAGLASGIANTSAQIGGALGLAVLATLATARTQNLLAVGGSMKSSLTGGFDLAFAAAAGLLAVAIAVAAIMLRNGQLGRQAPETEAELEAAV
jgi:hypothetical protein